MKKESLKLLAIIFVAIGASYGYGYYSNRPPRLNHGYNIVSRFELTDEFNTAFGPAVTSVDTVAILLMDSVCMTCPSWEVLNTFIASTTRKKLLCAVILISNYSPQDLNNIRFLSGTDAIMVVADSITVSRVRTGADSRVWNGFFIALLSPRGELLAASTIDSDLEMVTSHLLGFAKTR